MIKFDIAREKREIGADALANPAKAAKREAVLSRISRISSGPSLKTRIHAMAERWDYAPDELAEALSLAAADPVGWDRLCMHDQSMSKPEPEEWDTQPLETVRCADCQHYQRTNHPHLGHCVHEEIEAVVGLWDSDRRLCESYGADGSSGSA